MRPSKRVRELTAFVCQLAASNTMGWHLVADALGLRGRERRDVGSLVAYAFEEAYMTPGGVREWHPDENRRFQHWQGQMAEAEALLRTGWSPE
jgi:hypothetical protein